MLKTKTPTTTRTSSTYATLIAPHIASTDAFRDDAVARALTTLPPSIDDNRLALPPLQYSCSSSCSICIGGHMLGAASRKAEHPRPVNAVMDFHAIAWSKRVARWMALPLYGEHRSSSSTASTAR
jgi:hypothetical protein